MMHTNFEIEGRYIYNQREYHFSGDASEHFVLEIDSASDHLKITINPSSPIEFREFKVIYPYEYSGDCRILPNGYQSWTDTREYRKTDRMSHIYLTAKRNVRTTSLKNVGDYNFVKYPKKRGVFHGFSYGYVRWGDRYELIGSLNERSGYTILCFDCTKGTLAIRKELEGVLIQEKYEALDVIFREGSEQEVFDAYFSAMNIPKPREHRRTGYTTWYNYYPNINEKIVADDMEALSKLDEKIDIFQIDDGYQTAVGDWLSIDGKKFPNGMKKVADTIHAKGLLAGIWLAPTSAQKDSKFAQEHPDWLIRDTDGNLIECGLNWGGFYSLDLENPAVREHVRHFFDVILNEWGFDMVKLDFLYSACIIPRNNKSRGQLMCECMDFLRECVGDKLILGCGVPLAPAFGKVDFCRTGADMGLNWGRTLYSYTTHREDVSTERNIYNTIFRRGLNGRAFVNDPDVILLRDYNIHIDASRRELIAKINTLFGSLIFISDNIGRYNSDQMRQFREALRESETQIESAEYISKKTIRVIYVKDGQKYCLTFNAINGAWSEEKI